MFVAVTLDTWAVDLGDITLIYPWVGSEFIMAIAAIVAWIAWHVWQVGHENQEYRNEIDKYATPENIKKAIDDD